MHILVIENYRSCPVGVVGQKLRAMGVELSVINVLQNNDAIPSDALRRYAGLVVLGGAMGAYDDEDYPNIPNVVRLIEEFHTARKPVMAICLGAQILARALEQPPKSNDGCEIGFLPVHLTEEGQRDVLFEGGDYAWAPVSWHHDSFHLPSGAELLIVGEGGQLQGYRAGYASYGFQFHPEVDADILTNMVNDLDADYLEKIGESGRDMLDRMMRELPEAIEPAVAMAKQMTARWLSLCQ